MYCSESGMLTRRLSPGEGSRDVGLARLSEAPSSALRSIDLLNLAVGPA